jgi:hypothetical protein
MTQFEGVSGKDVLAYFGWRGTEMDVVAINDYKIIIPLDDLQNSGMLFATRKNGKAMSVREKGPVFVIYPFSSRPELDNEVIYARSIWQIKSIHFK